MKRIVKRVFQVSGVIVLVAAAALGIYVYTLTSAFDASMAKIYDVPLPTIVRSTDPAVLARGKHLIDSVAACSASDCHGADLAGGNSIVMGPVATFTAPNITSAGLCAAYNDGELARLIKHGIKKDGRSVPFMPSQDFGWLPDDDITAMISYIRTMPAVEKPNGPSGVKTLGKILDRQGKFPLDVARAIDHTQNEKVPAPAPNAEYGKFLGRMCTGCHGPTLSGGPLPGAPPDFAKPANLTPDPSGLAGWTYEDFDKLLVQGIRKSGKPLDKMMPIQAFGRMDDTEKHALWEYLKTVPAKPYGNR
jgi:cytochrome c553